MSTTSTDAPAEASPDRATSRVLSRLAPTRPPERPSPGVVLTWLSVAPAVLCTVWLAVSLPLLLAGVFRPLPALTLFVPVAGVALTVTLRRLPDRLRHWGVSWKTVWALVGIATGFAVLHGFTHHEQIVVRRDAASYVQFGIWLAKHGSLPIPQLREAFGGGDPALSYGSPAFYERGHDIIPQFMAGLPLTLAPAHWAGGVPAMLLAAPILGAFGILAFGGLMARLMDPRWMPLGAAMLAMSLPQVFVSRSTYSEGLAQVLMLGGLCLALDSLDAGGCVDRVGKGARWRAGLAGVVMGISLLVRIDALRDMLPVLAFAGLLAAQRRPQWLPLVAGSALGLAYGLVEGAVLSKPYLVYLAPSLVPLLVISGVAVVLVVAVSAVLRWRGVPELGGSRWPGAAAGLVVAVMVGLAVRPLFRTARGNYSDPLTLEFIAAIQKVYDMPVDPTRQYYEYSLYWVVWYVGLAAVVLAVVGAAMLTRRAMRGQVPYWTLPLAVVGFTTVTTLLRPAITPDHPWASRRLAVLVIPGVIMLAVWALPRVLGCLHRLGYEPRAVRSAKVSGVVALLLPVLATSVPAIVQLKEQGEVEAVRGLCRALPPRASAVIIDAKKDVIGDRYTQLIRGMCDTPAARITHPTPQAVHRVVDGIERAGRRPVLVAGKAAWLRSYGGAPVRVVHLNARQDPHKLLGPPFGTWPLPLDVWVTKP